MIVELLCTYCGRKWTMKPNSQDELVNCFCVKCGDKKISMKDVSVTKVDYYKGCPPFPPKPVKTWGFF